MPQFFKYINITMSSLSKAFMGCGWRFPFLSGVAKYMQDNVQSVGMLAGVSGGSAVAYALQQKIVDEMYVEGLAQRSKCKYPPFGACGLVSEVVKRLGTDVPLPGKLHIGVSQLSQLSQHESLSLTAKFFSSYESMDDMVGCMRASSQIPILDGKLFFNHRDMRCMDGEFTVDVAKMRSYLDKCVIVDFCDSADIRPSIHFPRFWSYVHQNDAVMQLMYNDGYAQARHWFSLQNNK